MPTDVLENVFWGGARYVDVNRLMPKLFDASRQLKDGWADIVMDECGLTADSTPSVIGGWSTGAKIAYAVAQACHPKKLILLAATPCFCRNDTVNFGTRPAVIDQMISGLDKDKDAVLNTFYERCGLEYDPSAIPDYTIDELSCGLEFLKQADLHPLSLSRTVPVFFHGADDQIIPISASKYFCEQVGGEHIEVGGNHAFFIKHRIPPEGGTF